MLDTDNDGDLDIVETNGQFFPFADIAEGFGDDPIRFWENDGIGNLTEVAAESGLDDTGSGKGLLCFDYDNDGDLDLFVSNNGAAPVLYRNDADGSNSWLQIETIGTTSNRQGIGARIEVDADLTVTGDEQVVVVRAAVFYRSLLR